MASYPKETLGEYEDDGTMVQNVEDLSEAVVGRKIVTAEMFGDQFIIELDNGTIVELHNINVQERDPDEKMIWIEIPESVVLNAVDPKREFTMSDGGAFRRACRQVADKLGLV